MDEHRHHPSNVRHASPDEPAVVVAQIGPVTAGVEAWKSRLVDYITLTKPEITFLVSISALAGFILGSPDSIDGWRLFWTLVGIPLVCAGGAALNHHVERRQDALMRRTAARPLPAGRILPDHARAFGYVLIAAGLGILCPLTNPLTGVLGAVTVILYVYVYTPLKRITPLNTLVGTLPGALPALGGWVAATGSIEAGGMSIFAVLLFWQMPHFLSLAWLYKKDYERAGFRMWTVDDTTGSLTATLTIVFTVLTVVASVLPVLYAQSGWIYLAGAVMLGISFLRLAVKFGITKSVEDARGVLKGSIWYIPILLLLIMADRLISL